MLQDVMVRDTNGNTLGRFELETDGARLEVTEAHLSDAGTIIVTVALDGAA